MPRCRGCRSHFSKWRRYNDPISLVTVMYSLSFSAVSTGPSTATSIKPRWRLDGAHLCVVCCFCGSSREPPCSAPRTAAGTRTFHGETPATAAGRPIPAAAGAAEVGAAGAAVTGAAVAGELPLRVTGSVRRASIRTGRAAARRGISTASRPRHPFAHGILPEVAIHMPARLQCNDCGTSKEGKGPEVPREGLGGGFKVFAPPRTQAGPGGLPADLI